MLCVFAPLRCLSRNVTIDEMNIALTLLQSAPKVDEVRRAIDPILRHGRDNISYLYSLDGFDWTVIIMYFTVLGLLAILGLYRVRMVYQFWRSSSVDSGAALSSKRSPLSSRQFTGAVKSR